MVRKYKRVERPHRPKTLHNEEARNHAIELMQQNLTTKQIAEQSGISERQIRHYRENLKDFGTILAPKRKDAGEHESILDFSQSPDGQIFKVGKRNRPARPADSRNKKFHEPTDADREREVDPITRALVFQAHTIFNVPAQDCVQQYHLKSQRYVAAIISQVQKRAQASDRAPLHPLNFSDTPLHEIPYGFGMYPLGRSSGPIDSALDDDDERPKLPTTLQFILCENGDVPPED
ncbi:MAG: hypothetical protein Q9162_007038 [Coniocarpon cinnabarinum]